MQGNAADNASPERATDQRASSPARRARHAVLGLGLVFLLLTGGGCATIRTTDPPRTATEQFLLTTATAKAIEQLSAGTLRDRTVWVESAYLSSALQPTQEQSFLLGELRAKLLTSGVRLAAARDKAQVVLEVRSGGIGIDRLEFLLGIPATVIPGFQSAAGAVPVTTPELSILKSTRQSGFASIAFVAYWADTGELLASSGPFVGGTLREDFWVLGLGPRTVGDIPPVEAGR